MSSAFDWLDSVPFYQAGLQGYSDAAMRLVARRLGAPFCVTEALHDQLLVQGGRGVKAQELDPEDHPIAGQIMGSEPASIARAGRVLLELGYDVIDLNLACPVKKCRHAPRGGHLLARPERAIALLEALRQEVGDEAPLSVKLRRGTDDSVEAEANFTRVLERVFELGYHSVTVHGRSVVQKYEGPSRWGFLRSLTARYPDERILGSGDIFEPEDIFRMLEETGVKGVSVARGAIGNPWIFRQGLDLLEGREPSRPDLAEQRRVLEEHAELSRRFLEPQLAGRRLRKFGIKFSRHHPEADRVLQAFAATRRPDEWDGILEEHYPPGRSASPESALADATHAPRT